MAASLRLQPLRESSPSPLEALAREPTAIAYNRDRPTQPTALTGGSHGRACRYCLQPSSDVCCRTLVASCKGTVQPPRTPSLLAWSLGGPCCWLQPPLLAAEVAPSSQVRRRGVTSVVEGSIGRARHDYGLGGGW
ncbi:hypothetical protein MUK42_37527 [Musa troglodytarum]|uniref:Uncharacterized protein n=1 Tax=Musa troglodytarum TaxID=320322 RepID=A0A9E7EDD5_9LILI|nr:hypothetical protein MUK42_37527 [Musa troglodytarum]